MSNTNIIDKKNNINTDTKISKMYYVLENRVKIQHKILCLNSMMHESNFVFDKLCVGILQKKKSNRRRVKCFNDFNERCLV